MKEGARRRHAQHVWLGKPQSLDCQQKAQRAAGSSGKVRSKHGGIQDHLIAGIGPNAGFFQRRARCSFFITSSTSHVGSRHKRNGRRLAMPNVDPGAVVSESFG